MEGERVRVFPSFISSAQTDRSSFMSWLCAGIFKPDDDLDSVWERLRVKEPVLRRMRSLKTLIVDNCTQLHVEYFLFADIRLLTNSVYSKNTILRLVVPKGKQLLKAK